MAEINSNLSKREKLIRIDAEMVMLKGSHQQDLVSHLCAALSTLAKGTKNEETVASIIATAYPDFFSNSDD